MPPATAKSDRLRRVAWFVALWTASVAGLALVALAFRAIMTFVGLTAG